MIGGLGLPELIVILGIALLVFGAGRIPDIAKSLGKAIKEFRKADSELIAESTASTKGKLEDKKS